MTQPTFYPGFDKLEITAGDVRFSGVMRGDGPPLLLLHGYPETHIAWRHIAPTLAERYRVVAVDLPGYGGSRVGRSDCRWTKRKAGSALHALMETLGHSRYAVIGHDRGARVGYRMALDRPEAVSAFASLAVVPTLDALEAIDHRSASARFHWFFLSQPANLPERLLAAEPALFLDSALDTMTGGRGFLEPAARAAYHVAFARSDVRHAMCEDYRAALAEDHDADRADHTAAKRLACPVLVLWPDDHAGEGTDGPIAIWKQWARDVAGATIAGGHLLPEEAPDAVLKTLLPFLRRIYC